jgi:hypothetical protein
MKLILATILVISSLFSIELEVVKEKECQYKDKFFDKCKYYKQKHIVLGKELNCVEECQYWDKFFQKCLYEKKCTFDKKNQIFYKKECIEWDSFFKKCKEENTKVIKQKERDIKIILKRDDGH